MNMRFGFVFLLALMVAPADRQALAQQSNASPAPRLALVIGNASYPDSDAPLKEPINDARALAEELRRDGVGFEVDVGENLSKEAMRRALDRLYGKIKPDSVVLIFFSGYAIQSSRQSYMIPVDGQIWTEADVRRDGFNLDSMLGELNSRGAAVKIAILDASRRNPFERRFRPVSAGLAPVIGPTGTLVMYSAAPSTVVDDSSSSKSVFVGELLKEIRVSGLAGEEVFNRTRMDVSRASGGAQVPWFSSSLVTEFSFGRREQKSSVATTSVPETKAAPPLKPDPLVPETKTAVLSPPPALPPVVKTPADDVAIKDLDKKLQVNPNDTAALYNRGQVYARIGDFPRAIKDFDEVIRLNPRDPEALNNRCWAHAVVGDLQSALKDCDDALQIRPNFVDALDSRGFVKLKIGLPQNAISDYDAALQINVKHASSLYGRGIAKLRTGNSSGGNSDIAAAKNINPRIAEEFAALDLR
jgi:hypothetical protein